MINMDKRKLQRDYTIQTRTLSFKCDAKYEGSPTDGRDLLLKVFKNLLRGIKNSDKDIDICGLILLYEGRLSNSDE